jgi:hypothetical protein
MSREIKFRVWNTKDKKFFTQEDYPKHRIDLALEYWETTKHVEWPQQFTGLFDKNGKEIYEGDIMSLTQDGKPTAVIVYKFNGFAFKWIAKIFKTVRRKDIEPLFRNISLFEVIGNIYENPELLK